MNGRERKRLVTLERRARWLEGVVADYDYSKGGNPSRAKAELAALTWAIEALREYDPGDGVTLYSSAID